MGETYAAFKICIFGDGGVGKTSLTRRYLTGLFDVSTKMTLFDIQSMSIKMGASIFVKYVEVAKKRIALQVWDFGGEEQFRFLLPVYAHGSAAAIFMIDISRYITIEKVEDWLKYFREGLSKEDQGIPVLMVGGKLDLEEKRSIPKEKALEISKKLNMLDYIECSAKSGENVERVFQLIVESIVKNRGMI